MVNENCCIAVFDHQEKVRAATQALGSDISNVSVVSCCSEESGTMGYFCVLGHHGFRGEGAEFWNGWCEQGRARAVVWLAPLGMTIVVGPFVDTILAIMEDESGGRIHSPLGEALYRINVPHDSIVHYEAALQCAHALLVVLGSQDEVAQAHDILAEKNVRDLAIHLG